MGEKVSACLQFDIAIEEFWKFCAIFTIDKGMLLFFFLHMCFCFVSFLQISCSVYLLYKTNCILTLTV